MANFIKVIFFLVIISGIGIYLLSNQPEIFQGSPGEKILPPVAKYVAPSAPPSVSPQSVISPETPIIIPTIPDYLIPSGFSRGQLSPYFEKMRISAQNYSFYTYNPSEFKIYSNLSDDEKVNVTGWRIKTNHGEIIIPQAINVYEPSGLTSPQDIVLSTNNYVNIYLSINPINKNFRLNKCMGYLQNTYIFNPSLPQNCPSLSPSDISYLSGKCQSYIRSLWGCMVPNEDSDSFYASVGGSSREEVECRAFLDTINQNGCFQKHRWDDDFLSNEWRVWVRQHILDSQHDRVLFFDKQGLLVDEYAY